jgi:hypothetical protein
MCRRPAVTTASAGRRSTSGYIASRSSARRVSGIARRLLTGARRRRRPRSWARCCTCGRATTSGPARSPCACSATTTSGSAHRSSSGTIASHNRSASGSRSGGLSGAATTGLGKSRLRPSSFNTCNRRSGTGPREPTSTDRRPTSGNKKSFGVSSVEPHPAIKLVRGCLRPPARSHVDGLRMIAKPPPRADESVRVRADRRTPLGTRGPMPCRSDRTWRTPGTGHHRST